MLHYNCLNSHLSGKFSLLYSSLVLPKSIEITSLLHIMHSSSPALLGIFAENYSTGKVQSVI